MSLLTISEVARQIGLQPSAIRYYEKIRLLPSAQRMNGQRRYDSTVLYRLAIVQLARQLGFSLDEVRQLFFGFKNFTRASQRWRTLSVRKLEELEARMDDLKTVRGLLKKMMSNCHCETLDQCGKAILRNYRENASLKSADLASRARPPARSRSLTLVKIPRWADMVCYAARRFRERTTEGAHYATNFPE